MTIMRLSVVSLFICVGFIHAMGPEVKTIEFIKLQETICTQETQTNNLNNLNVQQIKEQTLQKEIKKRKLCNIVYGLATMTMIGVDLLNSYYAENGLFKQYLAYGEGINVRYNFLFPCECPNKQAKCKIDTEWCSQSAESILLYGVNDGITMYRLYAGLGNLYYLYQVQQALDKQLVTEDMEKICTAGCYVSGIGASITGPLAGFVGIINGIKNFPRTIGVWGLNAILDACGSFNWYQNEIACEKLLECASRMRLQQETSEDESESTTFADETSENETDDETSNDDGYEKIPNENSENETSTDETFEDDGYEKISK